MAGRRAAARSRAGGRGRGGTRRGGAPAPDLAVLRLRMSADDARELVERKKTSAFRTMIIRKPRREDVHVKSVDLYYEASVAASARYTADYYRRAAHTIRVERSVREVVIAGTAFAAQGAGALSKVVPGRGRNIVDIELDEHVYVDNAATIHLDLRGSEIDAPYRGDFAKATEADPRGVLDACGGRVRGLETDPAGALSILKGRLQERMDGEARGLNDEFTVQRLAEVYVPVYEARLVGPRRKAAIMRIDAARKSVI